MIIERAPRRNRPAWANQMPADASPSISNLNGVRHRLPPPAPPLYPSISTLERVFFKHWPPSLSMLASRSRPSTPTTWGGQSSTATRRPNTRWSPLVLDSSPSFSPLHLARAPIMVTLPRALRRSRCSTKLVLLEAQTPAEDGDTGRA